MESGAGYSHSYILSAPPEEGYAAACELARAILCTGTGETRPCGRCENCRKAEKGIHPDILTVTRLKDEKGKLKREIYVDQIRDIIADAYILPNEAEKKVYIIRDAGTMNPAAQNAFLKMLEEPPRFVSFLLVTETVGALLETVRSRCVIRYLSAGEDAPSAEARGLAEQYLRYAAAGAEISLLSFANENADRSNGEMLEFVRAASALLTDMLCGRLPDLKLPRAQLLRLTNLMKTAETYLRSNVSTKHVLGLLTVETVQDSMKR